MKKITLALFASFVASMGLVNAQGLHNLSENTNAQKNAELYIKAPAAYNKTQSSFSEGEHVTGVNSNVPRQANLNITIPYIGTYHYPTANATNALVYDNGPHFNMPGTPNVSLLETIALGMNSLGSGAQKSANNSMADDFTLAEEYDITSIDVYAYQTGATPPSVNAIYLRIWEGDPSGSGTVVWGDLTTNIMSAAVFENVYRASETAPTDTSRAIQKVTANTTGLTLDAGTYWVEYTFAGTSSSGPWVPPISILGQATTGNALQFQGAANAWFPVEDSGTFTPQGLPFQVYGTATGGGNACSYVGPSNGFENGKSFIKNLGRIVANDVTVAADEDFTLETINISAFIGNTGSGVNAANLDVFIYKDAGGQPGDLVSSQLNLIPSSQTVIGNAFGYEAWSVDIDITAVELEGQVGATTTYWIGISLEPTDGSNTFWENSSAAVIGYGQAYNDGTGYEIEAVEGVYTFAGTCDVHVGGGPFPDPYCGPLDYSSVEPITNVEVAGIANRSDAATGGTNSHEDFTAIKGNMAQGETYEITLEGNTDGGFTNRFVIFIDWNQNGILDDAGEVYVIAQELINSTGTDGKQIFGDIVVPANAVLGNTRMRVKKNFSSARINPCLAEGSYGQAEDYTINVEEGLGIADVDALSGFSFYPNPTADVINLTSHKNIETVSLYNLLGQQVFTSKVGATSSDINISHLSTGTYVMKVSVDGQIGTYKVVKN